MSAPGCSSSASLERRETEAIEHSILNGRSGIMPALGAALGGESDIDVV